MWRICWVCVVLLEQVSITMTRRDLPPFLSLRPLLVSVVDLWSPALLLVRDVRSKRLEDVVEGRMAEVGTLAIGGKWAQLRMAKEGGVGIEHGPVFDLDL